MELPIKVAPQQLEFLETAVGGDVFYLSPNLLGKPTWSEEENLEMTWANFSAALTAFHIIVFKGFQIVISSLSFCPIVF